MVSAIAEWFGDLNLEKVRVSRPSKFLFLCGGAREDNLKAKALNLRDYLLRVRPIRTKYNIILAEEATQLYRDTDYDDLITFEEDVARISAVVLVIAESAGSLAELGAFTANDTIRRALRVVLPSHHETAESFVRYGPVQRIKNENREYLGVYPWKEHAKGGLNISSAKPHYKEIVSFINGHLATVSNSSLYTNLDAATLFYVVYWVIYIGIAISPKLLSDTVQFLLPGTTIKDIRNKVYCMQLANWIRREPYAGKDYFYSLYDAEPFDYVYRKGVLETSTVRRKLLVADCLRDLESIPRYVSRLAANARVASR